ncbi:hypothetical protein PM082_015510 [Marasmius tenuissimus]|nr:hypothetical protein PM082_015510 [Marasmius tenuissimus]
MATKGSQQEIFIQSSGALLIGNTPRQTLIDLRNSVEAKIWLEILQLVLGDRAVWIFNMTLGSISSPHADLLSLSNTSRRLRALCGMLPISCSVIFRYSAWPQWRRLADINLDVPDWGVALPQQRLDEMKSRLIECLESAGGRGLDIKVVLNQDYFFEVFDTQLFDFLLTRPSSPWASVTLSAPLAGHGWLHVYELVKKLQNSMRWREITDLLLSAGHGSHRPDERDTEELSDLIQ